MRDHRRLRERKASMLRQSVVGSVGGSYQARAWAFKRPVWFKEAAHPPLPPEDMAVVHAIHSALESKRKHPNDIRLLAPDELPCDEDTATVIAIWAGSGCCSVEDCEAPRVGGSKSATLDAPPSPEPHTPPPVRSPSIHHRHSKRSGNDDSWCCGDGCDILMDELKKGRWLPDSPAY